MSDELKALFGNIDFVNSPDRGAGILLEWVKHSPNIVGLVQSIMPEIQELHDAQQDVFSTINIFEAVGTQLDDIFGEILNTPREGGQTDDQYRADLLSAISILARSGEILTMKDVFRALFAATEVSLFEFRYAAFKIQGTTSTIPAAAQLAKIRNSLVDAKQGGNHITLSITDSSTPFTLGTLVSPQLSSPIGLSTIQQTPATQSGGLLSSTFELATLSTPNLNSPNGLSGPYFIDETINGGTLSLGF